MQSDSQHSTAQHKRPVRHYDAQFQVTPAYRKSLPDSQNGSSSEILGANVPILQVGISNFRLPLLYTTPSGSPQALETSVTGTVSLDAGKKGINMSRIMRTFYEFKDTHFTPETLGEILARYRSDLGSSQARLKLSFNYPMLRTSLRSGLEGYQYYTCAYEGAINPQGQLSTFIHVDFIYSSACPCSSDLAEHAREERNIYSIPHSQRSKARIIAKLAPGAKLTLERMHELCLEALHTETQVMVKREDEQAFAELNGVYVKFVEDAARLLYESFNQEPAVADFQIACAHLESLHSHDAVAVVNKGVAGGFQADFSEFKNLLC